MSFSTGTHGKHPLPLACTGDVGLALPEEARERGEGIRSGLTVVIVSTSSHDGTAASWSPPLMPCAIKLSTQTIPLLYRGGTGHFSSSVRGQNMIKKDFDSMPVAASAPSSNHFFFILSCSP